jgi:cardiolipin synthase A/B
MQPLPESSRPHVPITSPPACAADDGARLSLLIDADEFRTALERDIAAAGSSVWLQTLSFEGDAVGRRLAAALHRCPAQDRRVIVDSFNRVIISGAVVFSPAAIASRPFQREASATHVMLNRLNARGTAVRYCAPLGSMLRRLPARNHKKSIIIDGDIAYIGGFNFTEHNFSWHDSMLRIREPGAVAILREDFLHTWAGHPRALHAELDGLTLDVLDGRTNVRAFAALFDRIAAARRRIVVHTPYLMFPFTERLAAAARRGVHVTVITPARNTVPALGTYIRRAARRHGFDLRIYPDRMSHLKAMLIDDDALVLGSSNFDYLSYHRHQEILATVSDRATIQDFVARVLLPDLARCVTPGPDMPPGLFLESRLRAGSLALAAISR